MPFWILFDKEYIVVSEWGDLITLLCIAVLPMEQYQKALFMRKVRIAIRFFYECIPNAIVDCALEDMFYK